MFHHALFVYSEPLFDAFVVSGERFEAGVGQVEGCDEIKREILHQLCIRPMAHSELVKALPENVRHFARALSLPPSLSHHT